MFDQILDLVKGQVSKTVGGMSDIPQNKKSAVVETASSSLMSGLKKFATPDKLASLLGGGAGAAGGLGSGVVSALTSKLGLSPAISQKIATAAIPAVMSLLSKRVGDSSDPGFNIESLIGGLAGKTTGKASGNILGQLAGAVTGKASGNSLGKALGNITGDASKSSDGGIVGAIGNIFGKKK